MKKILIIVLLFSYITIGVMAAKKEAMCDNYLRLHILANSDSAYDQMFKLTVKDYFFSIYENEFKKINSKEEMLEFINSKNKENLTETGTMTEI